MTYNQPGRRSIISRMIAAVVLTSIYGFGLLGVTALVSAASSTAAFAQRGYGGDHHRGRGYGRGEGRGRGWGNRDRGHYRGGGYGGGRGHGYTRGRPGACVVNAAGVRICM